MTTTCCGFAPGKTQPMEQPMLFLQRLQLSYDLFAFPPQLILPNILCFFKRLDRSFMSATLDFEIHKNDPSWLWTAIKFSEAQLHIVSSLAEKSSARCPCSSLPLSRKTYSRRPCLLPRRLQNIEFLSFQTLHDDVLCLRLPLSDFTRNALMSCCSETSKLFKLSTYVGIFPFKKSTMAPAMSPCCFSPCRSEL